MAFSQTTRFGLWKIDTGTVDQTTGDKVKENTDTIDANLGKVMADATDSTAGFLSQKVDTVSLDVDTGSHKAYAKHAPLVHGMVSDADYTLTTGQQRHPIITITDTGPVLTATRNIIVPTESRIWWFENLTAQSLVVKTAAGSGVTVPSGNRVFLRCNGTNVVALSGSGGGGGGGDMDAATYDAANVSEQLVGISAVQTMSNKRIRYGDLTVTADDVIDATYESKYIYVNSGSLRTLTIDPNSSTNLAAQFECWIIKTGAGDVDIDPGSGVSLNNGSATLRISAQWKAAHLRQRATDDWVVIGAE